MALENRLQVTYSFEDSRGFVVSFSVGPVRFSATISNRKPAHFVQNVGTSEEALDLADLAGTTIKMAVLLNLDPTNYVQVRTATGGTDFARLPPDTAQDRTSSIPLILPWESGITAPFLIANTAACDVEILLVPN